MFVSEIRTNGRVGVVESTANEGESDALGSVKYETRLDVSECPNVVEAGLGER